MSEPTQPGSSRLRPDDALAQKVTQVIRSGTAAELQQLLHEHPALARARLGDERGHARTLLHVVCDWPGHVPEAGAKVRALAAAGAEVDARFTGPHTETALHWAASSDDVEALDALLDAGAGIETDGAVIGGGTPIADAVAFGQWNAARRLLERGARPRCGRPPRSASQTASATSSPTGRPPSRTSTTRCGARRTAHSATRRACCSTAAPTPRGSGTISSTPPRRPSEAGARELAGWLRDRAESGPALRPPP